MKSSFDIGKIIKALNRCVDSTYDAEFVVEALDEAGRVKEHFKEQNREDMYKLAFRVFGDYLRSDTVSAGMHEGKQLNKLIDAIIDISVAEARSKEVPNIQEKTDMNKPTTDVNKPTTDMTDPTKDIYSEAVRLSGHLDAKEQESFVSAFQAGAEFMKDYGKIPSERGPMITVLSYDDPKYACNCGNNSFVNTGGMISLCQYCGNVNELITQEKIKCAVLSCELP